MFSVRVDLINFERASVLLERTFDVTVQEVLIRQLARVPNGERRNASVTSRVSNLQLELCTFGGQYTEQGMM